MTQGVLAFKYEEEKKDFGTTSVAGILLYLDLLKKMGFEEMVNDAVRAKEDKQGWSDYHFLRSLLLLNISGGDCVDDIKKLENDSGLRRIFQHLEVGNAYGRRRRQLLSQWRNGQKNALPSPSSIFRYLDVFHDEDQEKARQEFDGKAFIPSSNGCLSGLCGVNQSMLEFMQFHNPQEVATIDMDAVIVESQKSQALYSYKKCKGYQPFNAWWWEQGYMVHTEFRDGNVPAGHEQKRVFSETLSCLPPGVEKVYLRSDTAGYQHELLKYCEKGENARFGRIEFAIGCNVTPEFRHEVYQVAEIEWHQIYREVDGELVETGQEWAEIPYVPNAIGHSKKGPFYRYLGIREVLEQRELPGMECQQSFPFPTMEMNNKRYKLFGLVSNMDWDGEALIHWSRKRCGYSEHVHSEMKKSFCGGQLPSGKFGANAAWWWIMVLALNLTAIMKGLVLSDISSKWKSSRMKRMRYWLINIPGRVIFKSKELVVRLSRGHPAFELLISVRRRIFLLGAFSPG